MASGLRLGLCLSVLLLVFGHSVVAQAQISEAQLRAGVIVGVLRYANWTTPLAVDSIPAADSLIICSMGNAPGFDLLAKSGSKITIADKTLTFKVPDTIDNNTGCALVVVGAGVNNAKLAALTRLSILSICDTCTQPDQHAVTLFMKNQRIRFAVNMALAQQANVQFSAAMLELADRVER